MKPDQICAILAIFSALFPNFLATLQVVQHELNGRMWQDQHPYILSTIVSTLQPQCPPGFG